MCAEILYRVRLGQRARPHADRDTGDGEGKRGAHSRRTSGRGNCWQRLLEMERRERASGTGRDLITRALSGGGGRVGVPWGRGKQVWHRPYPTRPDRSISQHIHAWLSVRLSAHLSYFRIYTDRVLQPRPSRTPPAEPWTVLRPPLPGPRSGQKNGALLAVTKIAPLVVTSRRILLVTVTSSTGDTLDCSRV